LALPSAIFAPPGKPEIGKLLFLSHFHKHLSGPHSGLPDFAGRSPLPGPSEPIHRTIDYQPLLQACQRSVPILFSSMLDGMADAGHEITIELRSQLYDEGADVATIGELRETSIQPPTALGEVTLTTTTPMLFSSAIPQFVTTPQDFSTVRQDMFTGQLI
jgi:hypothetical protein